MAPLSDVATVRAYLDRAEAYLQVNRSGPALSRSHTSDSRTIGWYGPPLLGHRLAVDAELSEAAVPPALGRRYGTADFWARWTRAESLCKACDVPIPLWLRRHGLGVPQHLHAVWRTLMVGDVTVTVACVPEDATDRGAG